MFFQNIRVSIANRDNIPDKYAKNRTTTPKISIEVLKKYIFVVGSTKYKPNECVRFNLDIKSTYV
jgi:hypothetical protein